MDVGEMLTMGTAQCEGPRSGRRARSPAQILLGEDDLEMRRVLVKTLSAAGYGVVEAGSGLALLERACEARDANQLPALIVSDVRMPGHSGLDVLRTIRGWGWKVPVILITGFGDEKLKCEAAGAGATCLFSKPFDVEDLCTAVMYLLP